MMNGKIMFTRQETEEIAHAMANKIVEEQMRLRNDTPGRVLWTLLLVHHRGELRIEAEEFTRYRGQSHVLELIPVEGGAVIARATLVENHENLPSENLFTGDVGS